MKKPLILAAALLVGTAAVGTALATPRFIDDHFARWSDRDGDARPEAGRGEHFRLADRDHRRPETRKHHRERHHDDDDDDDDEDRRGGDRGRGRPSVTGPTDPTTPVPDNGLFQGKARPKVEVN